MHSLNFFIILLFIVLIISSMVSSCSVYKPATELLYNGMYPYTEEGFSNTVSVENPIKLTGFDGLLSSPGAEHSLNDIYIGTKSDSKCQSYGYTNSNGNLCFDENQIKLLRTRGGNCNSATL